MIRVGQQYQWECLITIDGITNGTKCFSLLIHKMMGN